ncbi:flagella basal body P-ring formation protein FlgA [Halobacteriovorax sp. BALOs_7]|uniref:Flagellar basal body P-ring formation protein FlgA n=1 Tax=Halobacteriovorax vibrionivorans TaxID=2152716 RepID=A0ABY0IM59_9BACT|nr:MULTISPECIES: flagellar basal body P-ring formation chaperone FlgA [Halobacteriovorax]AYF45933.1 flagella basal body P-ring formation protein FlgA [Halobacteriovorax sp. BALOs_7]RZF22966.1 flagellar basal body P-ring formation protein FlgA [Halobacteriovorax vibrionivorans]TGD46891.1 flagellar basal body P-ring formation protein FlgA [Halobacteriovorax sp. Y22]
MIKKLIIPFLFTSLTSSMTSACKVSFADKVYRVNNARVTFTQQGCNRSQIEILNEILQEVTGNLNLHHSRELAQNQIQLMTKETVFVSLEDSIKNQFSIPHNWKVEFHSRKPLESISVDRLTSLEFACNQCKKLGRNKVKITYDNKIKWLDIEVKKPVKAVVATNEINLSYKSIDKNNVKKKTIYTTDEKAVFKNIEEIPFYKSNKVISPGEVIKKRDLTPINLVSFGVPVKVTLINNGIKLSGTGTPLSVGKLEDFIKVKNVKTNKVYTAKVVGLNEVKVEL